MNVSLSPELEKLVADEVARGTYPSAGEVIRHALRLLKERSELRERKIAALREDLRLGIEAVARGEFTEYDTDAIEGLAEEIKTQGIEKLAEERRAARDA